MKRIALAGIVSMFLGSCSCSGPAVPPDGGVPPPPAPEDRVFSIGLTDNAGGAPQAAAVVNLKFRGGTQDSETVVATRVSAPPALDGDGADWAEVPASTIPLIAPPLAVGMDKAAWDAETDAGFKRVLPYDKGPPEVTVKAAYDDKNIYFMLKWADATENRLREQWSFDGTAWKRDTKKNEDKAYLAFEVNFPAFKEAGCAAACHVKERLGDFTQDGIAYRFRMHTNAAGEIGDIWLWKATTSNPMSSADDLYWDNVKRNLDGTTDSVVGNCTTADCRPPDGGVVLPKFMSPSGINANPEYLFDSTAERTPVAVAFDGAGADAGAALPGFVHRKASPELNIRAQGKWANGSWTVELSRALETGDPNDAQFPLK